MAVPGEDNFVFVIEQERTMLSGRHLDESIPEDLPGRLRTFRLKAIAPGEGQYIDDAKAFLNR